MTVVMKTEDVLEACRDWLARHGIEQAAGNEVFVVNTSDKVIHPNGTLKAIDILFPGIAKPASWEPYR
jgi:hypothetical protein